MPISGLVYLHCEINAFMFGGHRQAHMCSVQPVHSRSCSWDPSALAPHPQQTSPWQLQLPTAHLGKHCSGLMISRTHRQASQLLKCILEKDFYVGKKILLENTMSKAALFKLLAVIYLFILQ